MNKVFWGRISKVAMLCFKFVSWSQNVQPSLINPSQIKHLACIESISNVSQANQAPKSGMVEKKLNEGQNWFKLQTLKTD